MITKREDPPIALNLLDRDMQAIATTEYASKIIDARKYFIFQAITAVTQAGASAGEASLALDVYAKDRTTLLYPRVFLATALRTNTANDTNAILFGAGASSAIFGNGTLGTNLAAIKILFFFKLVIVVDTQADGTSSTMSVTLEMEG